jgi:hypothetical protein
MISSQSWESLLRRPAPGDHVVQLYTDQGFLARTVAHFLRTGFTAGSAAVVVLTPAKALAITSELAADELDVAALQQRGQLVMVDPVSTLAELVVDGMPDRERFFPMVTRMLDQVRAAGYPSVRLFGEMVNLLCHDSVAAALALEEMWNGALDVHAVSVLCAYPIDNFDGTAHRGLLHEVMARHSHLIPVEDYERLEQAVVRAYHDVFGPDGEPATLREHVIAAQRQRTQMPSAETALVALRGVSAEIADDVLLRARQYYETPTSMA